MCVAVGSFSLWDCGASRWAAHAILAGPGLQLMVSGPALRTAISNGSPCCSTHLFGNKMWHVLKEQCGFFNLSPEKTPSCKQYWIRHSQHPATQFLVPSQVVLQPACRQKLWTTCLNEALSEPPSVCCSLNTSNSLPLTDTDFRLHNLSK